MTFPVLTDPSAFRLVSLTGVATLAAALFAFLAAWGVCHMVYNVFFHPLRKIPGPFLAGACGIPYVRHVRNGTIAPWLKKLHEKYGDAVRIAPAEVSFISADTAWQDIYGHRTGQHKGLPTLWKNVDWYPAPANGVCSMVNATEDDHSRMRRIFAHAFSDKALRAQEPLVRSYTNLFIKRIHEHAAAGKPMEMVAWYNYVTFDIITDLAFGETLYCLRDSKAHEWVTIAYSAFKAGGLRYTRLSYRLVWWYDALRSLFKDTKTFENRARIFSRKASEAVGKRLEQLEQNPNDGKGDFMSYVPRGDDKDSRKTLTRKELDTNAVLFLIAGSETTATTLEGTTYLLLKNPDAYAKLTHEIRSTFSSAEEITFEKTAHLEYLTAVITEGLRMYPPVPTGFARKTPPGGAVVSGYYIPGNTTLYVSQHTANHSPRNFVNPDKFAPERWLGAEEYKDDKKSVWNPFSYGPGNCIGKNLAWNELRLTLSQILFEFDLELVDKEHDWLNDQKIFTLWDKKDLNVKFTPIRRKA